MWAQLVKTRIKPGREAEVEDLRRKLEDRDNPAWIQTQIFRNQNDPQERYILVYFESEEAARHHEQHPEQTEMIMRLRELYEGEPEFIDLEPVHEASPSST